jgi:hypothetical protein
MTRKVTYWVSTGPLAALSVLSGFTYRVICRRLKILPTWDIRSNCALFLGSASFNGPDHFGRYATV